MSSHRLSRDLKPDLPDPRAHVDMIKLCSTEEGGKLPGVPGRLPKEMRLSFAVCGGQIPLGA